jgi:hypothetical protein
MLPRDGMVGKHVWGVAATLLAELGSPEVVESGIQECRRKKANWREMSIWLMRGEILHAGARLKARVGFMQHLDDDPIEEDDPLVPCPRCAKLVYAYRVADDCKGH